MMDWGIPELRSDRLSSSIPTQVYAGGLISDPLTTLFVWRTCRFPARARGGVLAFFTDDSRFECLWRQPERYAEQFVHFGWGAVIEPDFSLWTDMALAEQLWSIYRMRMLGRLYQAYGLTIIPNLAWGDERSFGFCFQGIPPHAPVVAVECRTAGQTDDDRRAFLAGLSEGVRQVSPACVVIYGGAEHAYWLSGSLPPGPQYTLVESWTHARDRIRRQARQQLRHRNQISFSFPTKGTDVWADEDPAAAARVAELA